MAVSPHKGVRVIIGRQGQDFKLHALAQQQVYAADGGLDACLIAVKHLGNIFGETADGMDVPRGQRST